MNCIYEKCRYLLLLTVKKLLQINRDIYIQIQFQNSIQTQFKFFEINNGHLNCSDKSVSAEQLL